MTDSKTRKNTALSQCLCLEESPVSIIFRIRRENIHMTVEDVKRTDSGPALMLANEAVVRGALESDVKIVACYPGSPTSEILDTFSEVMGYFGDYKMHISTNEKVALETVAGATTSGWSAPELKMKGSGKPYGNSKDRTVITGRSNRRTPGSGSCFP